MTDDALQSHWEWLVPLTWNRLHYVDPWPGREDYDNTGGAQPGVAVCGLHAEYSIPGLFSRMGLPRCARCCAALGIPRGDGTPSNEAWARRVEAGQ